MLISITLTLKCPLPEPVLLFLLRHPRCLLFSSMATFLNPYAPSYYPPSLLQYHSPPPLSFEFCVAPPYETTIFYPLSSPLNTTYPSCYYSCPSPCMFQTSWRTKEFSQPWMPASLTEVPLEVIEDKLSSDVVPVTEEVLVEKRTERTERLKSWRSRSGWTKKSVVRDYWRPRELIGRKDNLVEDNKRYWIPKFRNQRKQLLLEGDGFHFTESEQDSEERTTVMIKNLPNKLMKYKLLEMLDKHCADENKKAREENSVLSEFDFLYLPMDFDSGNNLGYAFVNFTSPVAARRLHRAYHNLGWDQLLDSRKIREVTYARIQGLSALQKRFKSSVFICDSDDFLPVYFTPCRNGERETEQLYVGKRIPRLPLAKS